MSAKAWRCRVTPALAVRRRGDLDDQSGSMPVDTKLALSFLALFSILTLFPRSRSMLRAQVSRIESALGPMVRSRHLNDLLASGVSARPAVRRSRRPPFAWPPLPPALAGRDVPPCRASFRSGLQGEEASLLGGPVRPAIFGRRGVEHRPAGRVPGHSNPPFVSPCCPGVPKEISCSIVSSEVGPETSSSIEHRGSIHQATASRASGSAPCAMVLDSLVSVVGSCVDRRPGVAGPGGR